MIACMSLSPAEIEVSQSEPSSDAQQLMAKGLTHALRAPMHCEIPQPSSDPTTEDGSGAEGQPPTATSQSEGLTRARRDPAALLERRAHPLLISALIGGRIERRKPSFWSRSPVLKFDPWKRQARGPLIPYQCCPLPPHDGLQSASIHEFHQKGEGFTDSVSVAPCPPLSTYSL